MRAPTAKQARHRVVDASLYVRPDGGKLPRYHVATWLESRRVWYVLRPVYHTRRDAREACRRFEAERLLPKLQRGTPPASGGTCT